MSTRKTLIRLHKWKVDEARRKLSELYAAHAALVGEAEGLEASVLIEQAKAGSAEQGQFLYQSYVQSVLLQRESLEQSMAAINDEIVAALEVANDAFRELKKVEIVEEQHAERTRQEGLRKAQIDLDEIASTRFQGGSS